MMIFCCLNLRITFTVIQLMCLFNFVTSQKQSNTNKARKNQVMGENTGDDDDYDEDYMETNFFQPWNFPEHSPSFSYRDKVDKDEIVWTSSAGRLVQLLDPKRYNKLQTPGQVTGKTTHVEVAMYIESMSTYRAQSMDFEVDMYLLLSWTDTRLAHNLTYPILLTDWKMSQRMWQPDLYFVNSKFAYMHRVTTPNFMVVVFQDGYVLKTLRIDVTLACMLDLHDFPMDIQNCSAVIQSFAFVSNVVHLLWHTSGDYPLVFNPNIKINDMERVAVINDTCDSDYPLFRGAGRWSCLQATITMKRRLQFHVFQIFIPAAMLVVISWLSFWLDVRASPARISLTITTLLTLTTMSNGSRQELPHVPYMKANDIWFTVCQGFVFSVLLEYTLVNLFLGRHMQAKNAPKMDTSISETSKLGTIPLLALSESDSQAAITKVVFQRDWECWAKRVDTVAKFLFPTCFLIFIIVYWTIYVK